MHMRSGDSIWEKSLGTRERTELETAWKIFGGERQLMDQLSVLFSPCDWTIWDIVLSRGDCLAARKRRVVSYSEILSAWFSVRHAAAKMYY